jgi:hypothetical protein
MHMGTKDMMRDANLSKKRIELLILIEQRARLDLPISRWGGELNPIDASLVDSTRYKAQWFHTVSQHLNSFWTLNCFIDF